MEEMGNRKQDGWQRKSLGNPLNLSKKKLGGGGGGGDSVNGCPAVGKIS